MLPSKDKDQEIIRKPKKREADPDETITTAAGTLKKDGVNDMKDSNENNGQAMTSNLSVSGKPHRNNGKDGGSQANYMDLAAQTTKYGTIKATTNVGVRTNGFMQRTF